MLSIKRIAGALGLFIGLMSVTSQVSAQDIQSAPYSRYGYGTLFDVASVAYKGMGSVGIGMRDSEVINLSNPAGYAASDSLSFLMDMGVSLNHTVYSQHNLSRKVLLGSLDYLAFQFPLYRNQVIFSLGVKPFSNVGYGVSATVPILEDNGNYLRQTYTGTGSLQKGYIGIGWRVYKGLSIGMNANYLFGLETNTVYTEANSPEIAKRRAINTLRLRDWTVDFGVQYAHQITKVDRLVLGATFAPAQTIVPHRRLTIDENSGTFAPNSIQSTTSDLKTKLPMIVGFGSSLLHGDKLLLAGDVQYSAWHSVPNIFSMNGVELHDTYKVALGAEYRPDKYSSSFFDKMTYRLGLNYKTSYLSFPGLSQMNRVGGAIGLGIPIFVSNERTSYVNFSLEYTKSLVSGSSAIREDMIRLSMSVNFNETWFRKLKIY